MNPGESKLDGDVSLDVLSLMDLLLTIGAQRVRVELCGALLLERMMGDALARD